MWTANTKDLVHFRTQTKSTTFNSEAFLIVASLLFFLSKSLYLTYQINPLHLYYVITHSMIARVGTFGIIMLPILKYGRRFWKPALFTFLLADSILHLSALIYYRYYGDIPSISVLSMSGNIGGLKEVLPTLIQFVDTFLFLDIVLFPLIITSSWYKDNARKSVNTVFVIIIFTIYSFSDLTIRTFFDNGFKRVMTIQFSNFIMTNVTGLENFYFLEGLKLLTTPSNKLTPEERAYELKQVTDKYHAIFPVNGGAAALNLPNKPNIIVIQVESFSRELLNLEVDGQFVTPKLKKLADDNVYYSNFITQTLLGGTSDSDFSANLSLIPFDNLPALVNYKDNNYKNSLANILESHGYETVLAHGNKAFFYYRNQFYKASGFNHQWYEDDYIKTEQITDDGIKGIDDGDFFEQTYRKLEKLSQNEKPFYAYMITLTHHAPFKIHSKYHEIKADTEDWDFYNYIQSGRYMDNHIGDFINRLRSSEKFSNTIVMLFGDHGLPHSYDYHQNPYSEGYEKELYNNRVPFMVVLPKSLQYRAKEFNQNEYTSQLDVAPTLLDLIGENSRRYLMAGRSLLDDSEFTYYSKDLQINGNQVMFNGNCYNLETGNQIAGCNMDKVFVLKDVSHSLIHNDLYQ